MDIKLDREGELRIKGHLYEISQINDEILEGRQGYPMSERGYHETLKQVADCATLSEVDEVATRIKGHIDKEKERPPNRIVRRIARSIVSEAGYPATPYLNRA